MKKACVYIKAASFVLTALLAVSGCSVILSEPEIESSGINYGDIDEEFDQRVKDTFGFYLAYQNEDAELYINSMTTEIKLVEKATGREWTSNPPDRKNDSLAVSPDNPINAALMFRYMHGGSDSDFNPEVSSNLSSYNSWADSVEKGQYGFYKINNGIRVNYGVGVKQASYLVPTILSLKRYEELLSKMDEQGQYLLNSHYYYFTLSKYDGDATLKALIETKIPILKQNDIYLLAPLAQIESGGEPAPIDYTAQQLEPLLKSIGYTQKDLDRDNAENLVKVEKSTNVYFDISVEYTLDGPDLVVTIPKDSIKYDETVFHLMQVSVLPYFGAAGTDKSGYIFVPDGSGALINLNTGKTDLPAYSKQVYGSDVNLLYKNLDDTQIYLPVFGMKQENNAFFAIIEEGDAASTVIADISGRTCDYNTVGAVFTLKNSGQAHSPILARGYGITYYQQRSLQSDLQIRYKFLSGSSANYTGMALTYQKYLLDNGLIEKQSFGSAVPLSVDMLGAITHNAVFLGIPYKSRLPLTEYVQAVNILEQLKKNGVERVDLNYFYWCNGGIQNSLSDDVTLVGRLGSKKDFERLRKYTEEHEINFYPQVDFAYITESAGFRMFYKSRLAVRYVDNTTWPAAIFSKSIPSSDSKIIAITPRYFESMIDRFSKKYKKLGAGGLSVSSLGTDLSGDYKKENTVDRQMAADIIAEQLEKLQREYKLSIKGANAFTLKSANSVNNIPAASGENYLFDSSVPFYQIVLHGILPYSGEPLNLSSDYKKAALNLIESGTIPSFRWMFAENSLLRNTAANFYGVHYSAWLDEAVEIYNEVNNVLAGCQTAQIISHRTLETGFTETGYSNGTTVLVNYNEYSVRHGEITVEAQNYKVVTE